MISELVRQQAGGYVLCVIAGAAAGGVAVILNCVVVHIKRRRWLRWIADIGFWLAIGVLVIAVSFICCDGRLRAYIFLGFFSGFLLTFCATNWVAFKAVNYILCHLNNDSKKVKKRT